MPHRSLFMTIKVLIINELYFFLHSLKDTEFRQVGSYIFFKLMRLTKRPPVYRLTGFNVNNLKW